MIVLQAGLCLLMTFAVLAFGAVQVWSQSILEIGAAVLLAIWAMVFFRDKNATIEWNWLNVPLAGFLVIGALQLLFRGTEYPYATTQELLRLAAYCILFFLTTQAFRTRGEKEALVWVLMALCFAVSLLGIIQHFTAEKQIYWMSSLNVQNDSFGPFVNRNHFAGFVELTLPVALAQLIFRGLRRDAFPLLVLLAIVPLSALILSGSRGGIIGFVLEVSLLALMARMRRGEKQHHLAALAMVVLAAVALIAWLGTNKAVERFSQARNIELSMSRRVSMSRSALHIFLDHPIKGVGLGALAAVYPRYETHIRRKHRRTRTQRLSGGTCRVRNRGWIVGVDILIPAVSRCTRCFSYVAGTLFARASRRSHCGCQWIAVAQLYRLQFTYTFQRPAFSRPGVPCYFECAAVPFRAAGCCTLCAARNHSGCGNSCVRDGNSASRTPKDNGRYNGCYWLDLRTRLRVRIRTLWSCSGYCISGTRTISGVVGQGICRRNEVFGGCETKRPTTCFRGGPKRNRRGYKLQHGTTADFGIKRM